MNASALKSEGIIRPPKRWTLVEFYWNFLKTLILTETLVSMRRVHFCQRLQSLQKDVDFERLKYFFNFCQEHFL